MFVFDFARFSWSLGRAWGVRDVPEAVGAGERGRSLFLQAPRLNAEACAMGGTGRVRPRRAVGQTQSI